MCSSRSVKRPETIIFLTEARHDSLQGVRGRRYNEVRTASRVHHRHASVRRCLREKTRGLASPFHTFTTVDLMITCSTSSFD